MIQGLETCFMGPSIQVWVETCFRGYGINMDAQYGLSHDTGSRDMFQGSRYF